MAACLALTAFGAQIRIPLWFTPVPVTGQVFGVICTGLLLDARAAVSVQFAYVFLGVLGIPWFTNGGGGAGYLLGPTGGYLVGFMVAAGVIAVLRQRISGITASLTGVAVIYLAGTIWLAVYLNTISHMPLSTALPKAFWLGVAPFWLGDVVKAVLATLVSSRFSSPSGRADRTQ
ncbi:hypothetical protein AUK40_05465 [Candidatus Wirthbacteria bacterium CG2_30_54_11]|uniref:Biotin transporter n=1 Tax=Candidatus Wirthbacteria bacterium CG2_30_54_11 TaxID=1817892 RepID=A0A1J5IG15_9BACT|nr:MAG: hypothetical protein AUK40_05465 [Candidatus Wirthbacteria bacterium CG2_30_54_11]